MIFSLRPTRFGLCKWIGVLVALTQVLVGCQSSSTATSPDAGATTVSVRGRQVELLPFYEGFPYTSIYFDLATETLYYLKKGDSFTLYKQNFQFGTPVNLAAGEVVDRADYSKRNFWGLLVNPVTRKAYVKGDEDNKEIINWYAVNEAQKQTQKITNVSYVYGSEISADGRYLAYTSRSGAQEYTPGHVNVMDLSTGENRVIYSDSKKHRMNFGSLTWSDDQKYLVVSVVCNENRDYQALLKVPVDGSRAKDLINCTTRKKVGPLDHFVAKDSFMFVYDHGDGARIGRYQPGRKPAYMPRPGKIVSSAAVVGAKNDRLLVIEQKAISSVVELFEPLTGKLIERKEFPALLTINDSHGDQVILTRTSASQPYEALAYKVGDHLGEWKVMIELDAELKNKIVQCDVEKVSFKTFDGLAAPGEPGTLHGFLYKPKNPAPHPDQFLFVEAFYGGVNRYTIQNQIYCAAGFYVFSPAPRGSWEWGAAFHRLMQGDWGGNEMLDVMAGTRKIAEQLKIPSSHVGAFGGSHGGYATLRLLTFPGEVNGHKDNFRWGFGVADYPVVDIVRGFQHGNIPGWYIDLTGGDPTKNPKKWRERSPQYSASLAHGPVIIIHGENDKRIDVEESREMTKSLQAAGKPVTYVEMPGQGHGFKGRAALLKRQKAVFDFLNQLPTLK